MKAFFLFVLTQIIQIQAQATLFTIHEGDHYSTPKVVRVFRGDRMDLSVGFDESARYDFGPNQPDQADTNKLYGFSDCRSGHMTNSARFGWRYFEGQLQIMAFTHKNGVFSSKYITSIEPNQTYQASISLSADHERYVYEFNGVTTEMERGCDDRVAFGYHVYPYFGGNQTAPHDVRIRVDLGDEVGPAWVDLPYPNPVVDRKFKLKVNASKSVYLYLKVYDVSGRLVWNSPRLPVQAGSEVALGFEVPLGFASGLYLAVPVTVDESGTELRAGLTNRTSENALRILVLH